ncbi:MAG: 2-oxoacid:acceptor oxidoreductase subunit alpha [bacterium]|nr:2-oxoacid:acceptor oxidoreductase subunit alpha [bacterium]
MKFLWKIGGEAGFGIMTTGLSFAKIATQSGYHIFDYAEYPSLIRGGHNTYDVLVSDEEVWTSQIAIDMLVCLNKDTYTLHKSRLKESSIVVYDPEMFEITDNVQKISVPLKSMIKEAKAFQIMVNTITLGASAGLLGADEEVLYGMIETQFAKKGEKVVEYNRDFAKKGYDYILEHYQAMVTPILKKRSQIETKLVMTGNEAFSYGAIVAQCRFFSGYPMTPTSNVLTQLAGWQEKSGMVVRHSEDEIAVINTALGASFAGARSAVATSGGGFALMVEAISYAGVAEIPIVIFLGQRPGPATGMPTWTEQGDLLFACHAGHGEFPKIVLAPGDVNEMIEMTAEAFDLADIYQTPVIVISDKFVCESHKSVPKMNVDLFSKSYQPNRGKLIHEVPPEKYLRYKISDDGISPRLIPGIKGSFYQANSYDHIEDSHTTEDGELRKLQVEKRGRKWDTYLKTHYKLPTIYGDITTATHVFIAYGPNKGSIKEAQKLLKEKGIETAFIHFTHVYPLDRQKVRDIFAMTKDKKCILVENNSQGQFGKLLAMEAGIEIEEKILKYDGRPIYPEEIVASIK